MLEEFLALSQACVAWEVPATAKASYWFVVHGIVQTPGWESCDNSAVKAQPRRGHGITGYAELEGTCQDHGALHKTPQETHQVPGSIVQTFPELRQARCCNHFLGEPVPVPSHCLGGKNFSWYGT